MNDLSKLVQGTEEWLQARCGSLGASQIAEALALLQKGWGVGRTNLRRRLRAERLTGKPSATYQSENMRIGKEREPEAREAYCWERGVDVEEVGIIIHPRIKWTHASPDGLVSPDGAVEFKCPTQETHSDILKGAGPEGRYLIQCCWIMACTGRKWIDLCSYHPHFKPHQRLIITRIMRDDAAIAQAEELVEEFLREVEAEVASVNERHPEPEIAA
jgi:putative phage-type endonuclease